MENQKALIYSTICRVVIKRNGITLVNDIFSFQVGVDPKTAMEYTIRDQLAKKRIDCDPRTFLVEISEVRKQAVNPILIFVRCCPKHGLADEQYKFCGQCGQQTEWKIKKTE
ncbi:MAG: hypothetical protein PHW53_02355 [Patescibacteria group bacterium]|nr:hypothetical protein [Patescibacteria group bacterium]